MSGRAGLSAAIGLCAAASLANALAAVPRYAAETCSRVALVDTATGDAIRGAEDLAVDSGHDRLIVSAHDRRAVAKAVSARAGDVPQGGIYAVSFSDIRDGLGKVAAAPLVDPASVPGGLRPHGVAYIPQTDEIAFVNRAYQKIDGRWRLTPKIVRVGVGDGAAGGEQKPTHCAANDLIADEAGLLVSFDHGDCGGWRRSLEEALVLRRSGVSDENGAPLFDGAAYANGLLQLVDGSIAVAATREKALLILDRSGAAAPGRRIALPGGPDNLTPSNDEVVAAVHPSTLRLAAALRLGLGKAPSRAVKIDPATGDVRVLFDDPTGRLFSGASVAVERDGVLILGSAIDEGLLVCHGAAQQET
jgi:hypothetical protein